MGVKIRAPAFPPCHGRAWPGHPRLCFFSHGTLWVTEPEPVITRGANWPSTSYFDAYGAKARHPCLGLERQKARMWLSARWPGMLEPAWRSFAARRASWWNSSNNDGVRCSHSSPLGRSIAPRRRYRDLAEDRRQTEDRRQKTPRVPSAYADRDDKRVSRQTMHASKTRT
jgi:hypothetical protein